MTTTKTPKVRIRTEEQPAAAIPPSAEVVAQAAATFTVTDERGRVITLKKPGVLAQFRLVQAVGPDTAKNQVYMGMVMPIIFVSAIDGDPVFPPSNFREVEALIQRLDDDGMEAVMTEVGKRFGKPDPDADKEAVKN